MKRLLFSLTLLTIASPCFAQNARKDDVAMQLVTQNTSAGTVSFLKPVPGAVITIGLVSFGVPSPCTITNTASGSTVSCSALAPVCSSSTDAVCTQPNPTNADANGNYGFWTKPSRVQVAITGIGVNGKTLTYDLGVGLLDAGPVSLPNNIQGSGGLLTLPPGPGPLAQSNLSGPRFQQFTSSGTFTIPANVTVVKVTVVGGGGAGGGGTAAANSAGSGGGGGGIGIKWLSGLTPGNTLSVTIGPGGTGVSGGTGGSGSASDVFSGTQIITSIIANGGTGGSSGSGFGVAALVGSGGDVNFAGNPGAFQTGTNFGSHGAPSPLFGGAGQGSGTGSGNPGQASGAGGGGGQGGTGNTIGGAGANGIAIFEWVI